jgi:hypothetical protein
MNDCLDWVAQNHYLPKIGPRPTLAHWHGHRILSAASRQTLPAAVKPILGYSAAELGFNAALLAPGMEAPDSFGRRGIVCCLNALDAVCLRQPLKRGLSAQRPAANLFLSIGIFARMLQSWSLCATVSAGRSSGRSPLHTALESRLSKSEGEPNTGLTVDTWDHRARVDSPSISSGYPLTGLPWMVPIAMD